MDIKERVKHWHKAQSKKKCARIESFTIQKNTLSIRPNSQLALALIAAKLNQ